MTVNHILNIGAVSLRAHSSAVNVTSQNLTGGNAPGYSRRAPHLEALPGGRGVIDRGSARVVDRFIERRILGTTSERAGAEARLEITNVLDEVLADAPGNLGEALDDFYSAIHGFASQPSDPALRSQVLSNADRLAGAFGRAMTALREAQDEAEIRADGAIDRTNALAHEIATIQAEISRAELSGEEASGLRDNRDQKLRELAELVPIDVVEDTDGSLAVLLAGREALITTDATVNELQSGIDASGALRVMMPSAGQLSDVTDWLQSGSIGGWLQARDGAVADMMTELDQLAYDVGTSYNDVHSTGFGLDGAGGRNLFDGVGAVAGAASAISVSADVQGQPANLAAAADPGLVPGDPRIAIALTQLQTTSPVVGNSSPFGVRLADLVQRGGTAVQDAEIDVDARGAADDQARLLRESISGVSSDEEMIALIRYQRGYEASLRVIQTADEMLESLIALKR